MSDLTQVSEESPRECCANLAMTFRELADREDVEIRRSEVWGWVARLERAVQRLDAEKIEWREKLLRAQEQGPSRKVIEEAMENALRADEIRKREARNRAAEAWWKAQC